MTSAVDSPLLLKCNIICLLMTFLACGGPMDIVIVLDGSNSIYPWEPMTDFLQKLIPGLDIGPKNTQVTSCFISYTRKFKLRWSRGWSWVNSLGYFFILWSLLTAFYTLSHLFLSRQVSVIQYAVNPKFEFKLNQYKTKDEVIAAASRITQMYGHSTNTFHAIEYARLVFQ